MLGADARGAEAVWSRHVAPGGSPAVESDPAGGDVCGADAVGAGAVGDGVAGSFHWMVEPGGSPGDADVDDDGADVDEDADGAEEVGVSPGVFQWIVDSACGCTDVDGSARGAFWHAPRESTTRTTATGFTGWVMVMGGFYHAQRRAGEARPLPASEQIEAKSWTLEAGVPAIAKAAEVLTVAGMINAWAGLDVEGGPALGAGAGANMEFHLGILSRYARRRQHAPPVPQLDEPTRIIRSPP